MACLPCVEHLAARWRLPYPFLPDDIADQRRDHERGCPHGWPEQHQDQGSD